MDLFGSSYRQIAVVIAVTALLWAPAALGTTPNSITVATWNIQHGMGLDGQVNLERIAENLIQTKADVICLQEVDRSTTRSGGVDQARFLAARLGMDTAFGGNIRFQKGEYGNAVLSRFPIRSSKNLTLPGALFHERRGALLVQLDAVEPITVVCTHLDVTSSQLRRKQVNSILSAVGRVEEPTIVAGDFNAEHSTPEVAEVRAYLNDAYVQHRGGEDGGGLTLPANRPKTRADYLFISPTIKVLAEQDAVRTLKTTASDHLPVIAQLSVAGEYQ